MSTFESIASAQSKSTATKSSAVAQRPTSNGITLSALVLSSVNKGYNANIKATVHSYQVFILETGRADSYVMEAERGGIISRPLGSEEKGFRMVRANGAINKQTLETYRSVNIAYNNTYDKGDHGRTDKVIKRNSRETPRGTAVDYSLETPLLSKWSELAVTTGQARYFEVKVGEQDALIPRGRFVTLRGITVDLFATKPKKEANATTAAAGESSNNTNNPEEEGGAEDSGFAGDAIEYLRDASTNYSLRFKLRCDVIYDTGLSETYGKLPTDRLFRTLLDMRMQQPEYLKPGEFGHPLKCLILPLDAAGLEKSKDVDTGIVVGTNTPSRFIKEMTRDVDATSPEAYEWGKTGATLNCLPVHASLIHYHRASKDIAEEERTELSERFVEVVPEDAASSNLVFFNKAKIDAIIWSSQTYASGVTDPALWRDVNAQARIPCIVIAKPLRPMAHEATFKMKVLAVAWRTKEYVLANSFEVPLAFAREILGGKDVTNGKTEFGKEQAAHGRPELIITNELNKARGEIDLLNATESKVELKPYLDPANKWHARVQLVVNTVDRTSDSEEVQKDNAELVAKSRALATPEEGQRFVQEYIDNKIAGRLTLNGFGMNQKTHRVIVWFVRYDEDVYDAALLALPPLVDLAPPPPPPPTAPMEIDEKKVAALKRPHEDVAAAGAPNDEVKEPEAKKARKE